MGDHGLDERQAGQYPPSSHSDIQLKVEQIEEVYQLLSGHYVEDPEAAFRLTYSASFLNWYELCLELA